MSFIEMEQTISCQQIEIEDLKAANAVLELEVTRLRNALETFIAEHEECEDFDGWTAQVCSMEALHVADEALSTPFTPTALPELIEKVEKRTIERCASEGGRKAWSQTIPDGQAVADAIRALPTGQIKIEELL